MQTYEIIGIRDATFTPKDSDREIKGTTLFVTTEQKGTTGLACERLFVKQSAMETCGKLEPGQTIALSYNRWAKIENVDVIAQK